MKTEGCDKVCLFKGTSKSGSFLTFGLMWLYRSLGLNSELMEMKFCQLNLNSVGFKLSTAVVVSN